MAKLIAQWITGSLIFYVMDVQISSFYGLSDTISFSPGVSYVITVATVIIVTNSLNLIDGIDGLAGVFSFVASLSFGTWFYFAESYPYALICFSLCGGILAFLFQNWEPSRIFMGDTGSLVIGTVLSTVMIEFINENHAMTTGAKLKFTPAVSAAIAIMILPLTDTIRIIIIRINKGISLFTADKRHIHHALVRLTLSHKQAVYVLSVVHFAFIGMAIGMRHLSDWHLLPSIIVSATILCIILERVQRSYLKSEGQVKREGTTSDQNS
jgi:UDP-GlcNAc:undecaprenyl-phosphate/decaprenyl-phosphate GlcNAc-1-phosphate transferase